MENLRYKSQILEAGMVELSSSIHWYELFLIQHLEMSLTTSGPLRIPLELLMGLIPLRGLKRLWITRCSELRYSLLSIRPLRAV